MRILVISDIHANLAAFEAVLTDATGQWDKIWCLGDLVGYGPDPNECVTLLRQYNHLSLSGNHDWAVLGRIDINHFNPEAQRAINWTGAAISSDTRDYLEALPSMLVEEPFTLAHASPRQPVWEYILDSFTAATNFEYFDTPYCLVGHTHIPIFFEEVSAGRIVAHSPGYDAPILLNHNRLILNPGSVGQPRDSDPRAAYVLLDTEQMAWTYRRVTYPIAVTQDRMHQYGMPQRLVKRLEYGW
jgi:predicted phosphodiesterase